MNDNKQSLGYILTHIDSEESRRGFQEYLKTLPYPHYEGFPGYEAVLIKTEADGSREVGKFVDRNWISVI